MQMDSAMDLSLRNAATSAAMQAENSSIMTPSSLKLSSSPSAVKIVRPIPRPPWSILWYQNLWAVSPSFINQSESRREGGCDGNNSEQHSKANTVLRTNERSSFSVLNNLNNNTVDSCINNDNYNNSSNNYNSNFPFVSPEQQVQHTVFQLPTEKYCNSSLPSNSPMSAASSSLYKPRLANNHHGLQNFIIGQKQPSESEYSSDNDIDSDNSENIVVTTCTSSSFPSCRESDSMVKSSSFSLGKPDLILPAVLSGSSYQQEQNNRLPQTTTVLDVACCDGPVQFKRISNPNFALTVEHNEICPPANSVDDRKELLSTTKGITAQINHDHEKYEDEQTDRSSFSSYSTPPNEGKPQYFLHQFNKVENKEPNTKMNAATVSTTVTTQKNYLCIYCNQSFKSLFCYQKHKKRHLNPVSVDITTTTANSTSYRASSGTSNKRGGGRVSTGCGDGGDGGGGGGGGGGMVGIIPENAKAKTKDLNVQFFPCKKCGCKFPSYYFVHKHRKICH